MWLFLILSFSAILVFVRVIVFPLWASFWSARTRNVVEEINPRLQLHLSSFTLSPRRVLADRLACDASVEAGVEKIARERGVSIEKIRREAWRMAWDIVPGFNPYFYFRAGYRIARRCLRSLYKLRVAFVDEDTMDDVSDRAAVVFIINHRSNMDYVLTNYVTASRTMLSFGVGEWSRVWPIQPLMRMAGGYFVRRDSGDPLYRLLLKRYVQLATEARLPHAIFLEGQLSPDGNIGNPQLGLLSYVTENFDAATTPDIIFMPVGINYDRIPEDQNLLKYSSKEFRSKGSFYVLKQGIQFGARVTWELILNRRAFGYTCARFGKPISFKDWLSKSETSWPKQTRKEKYLWISELGDQLIDDISQAVPATPVSVFCRIWADDLMLALDREELNSRFQKICAKLKAKNCHLVIVDDDARKTMEHALELTMKRKLIIEGKDGVFRVNPKMSSLIAYYGNSLNQFFED